MAELSEDLSQTPIRSRRNYLVFGLILALLLMGWAAWWVLVGSRRIATNDAYVEGNVTPVQAQSAGTIRRVYVENTEYVRAGTILASLQGDRSLLVSLAGRIAPPMVGVMAPLKSVEIGVSNGVKIGRFLPLSQPASWAPRAGVGEHGNSRLPG